MLLENRFSLNNVKRVFSFLASMGYRIDSFGTVCDVTGASVLDFYFSGVKDEDREFLWSLVTDADRSEIKATPHRHVFLNHDLARAYVRSVAETGRFIIKDVGNKGEWFEFFYPEEYQRFINDQAKTVTLVAKLSIGIKSDNVATYELVNFANRLAKTMEQDETEGIIHTNDLLERAQSFEGWSRSLVH